MAMRCAGNPLVTRLCEILGIEPSNTRRITITFAANDLVRVRVEQYGTEDLNEVDFEGLLEDAEVDIVHIGK